MGDSEDSVCVCVRESERLMKKESSKIHREAILSRPVSLCLHTDNMSLVQVEIAMMM